MRGVALAILSFGMIHATQQATLIPVSWRARGVWLSVTLAALSLVCVIIGV